MYEIEHPALIRLREIESYLDNDLAFKDMADLKVTIYIVEHEGFQKELREKNDKAVQLFEFLMARKVATKRKELEEEERRAEEVKKALEEAEKEVLRQQEGGEEALRNAIKTRNQATLRWASQCPRLQILRALNGIEGELIADAIEDARKVREEEERQRRFEKDQAERAAYCKQLLRESIATCDKEKLKNAITTTDWTVYRTTMMDTDEELKVLHDEAKNVF